MDGLQSRSDEELLDRARSSPDGDMRAFETLVRRYQQKVKANCRYLTRNPDDAEDLAQEVFVKAFFGLGRFEGRSAFRTWLQRIKANHRINHMKKQQGKSFVPIDDPDVPEPDELSVAPQAERRLSAKDDRERIGLVLDSMADTLRVPLIMRDMDQLSYQEIAELLSLGLSAVKMRVKRGREEFQTRFRALRESPPAGPASP